MLAVFRVCQGRCSLKPTRDAAWLQMVGLAGWAGTASADNVPSADNAGSSSRTVLQCYCVSVKNLTVTIPDDVYRTARIRAAEAGTSVSAMVAAYLRSLDADAAEFDRRARLQLEIMSQIRVFSASARLGRNEVHDRALR